MNMPAATPQDVSTKLITKTTNGNLIKVPVTLRYADGRIEFIKSPFAMKAEIKAMKGSRWHGYIEGDNRKIWSIEDCFAKPFSAWLHGRQERL